MSYITEGETTIMRVGLATQSFTGSQTAIDIEPWIETASVKLQTIYIYFLYHILFTSKRAVVLPVVVAFAIRTSSNDLMHIML